MTSETRRGFRPHPYLRSGRFRALDAERAAAYDPLIDMAIAEDVGREDITTAAVIDENVRWSAKVVARAPGIIAGLPIAARVFFRIDPRITVAELAEDGTPASEGMDLALVTGPARGLLTAERVALNFLGRLSGIATLTKRYVDAVGSLPTRIADTRKTTPGLRSLERYAVRAGGGANHRLRLDDAVLIKDNHLAAAGSVTDAVRRARSHVGANVVIEVECDDLEQVREALAAGADAVLLDNMNIESMRAAVDLANGNAIVEASGGMTLERVPKVAATGVDVISVGALTHSAPSLDVALDFSPKTANVTS